MVQTAQASNRGYTLLELTLSLALAVTFLTAFLASSQALMQGLWQGGAGLKGQDEAGSALDQMYLDLEQASSFYARSDYAIDFQTLSGKRIAYRLFANGGDPLDTVLEKSVDGASSSIGPRRMIANLNPHNSSFNFSGTGAPSQAPQVLFTYQAANAETAPRTNIWLILQANKTAPIYYMRTKAMSVTMHSW